MAGVDLVGVAAERLAGGRPAATGLTTGELPPPDLSPRAGRRPGWLEPVAVAVILGFALIYPLAWSNVLPYGRGPDEPDHFDMVDFILAERRLPVFGPDGDRWIHLSALGQPVESYAAYPLLTYLLAAPLALVLPTEPFRAARLVSTLSVPLIALCTFLVGRRLASGRPAVYLVAMALVPLVPQVSFVGAYLNRDALGAAFAAVVVWLAARAAFAGWTARSALAVGAALGLVAATNYPAYPVAVVPALLMLTQPGASIPRWLRWGTCATAGAVATGGWWFARNLALYGELMPERLLQQGLAAAAPDFKISTADRGYDVVTLLTRTRWLLDTFSSFWGVFDLQNLFLAPVYYGALIAGCALAGVGCLAIAAAWLTRRRDLTTPGPRVVTACAVFILLTLAASVWSSVSRDNSPQGRYLFPALVPLAVFLAAGWQTGASALVRLAVWGGDDRLWTRGAPTATLALCLGLGWLNLAALRDYVIPRYYGGAADRLRVTVNEPDWGSTVPSDGPIVGEGWAIVERSPTWRPEYFVNPPRWYTPVDAVRLYADAAPGTGGVELGDAVAADRPDVARRFGGDRRLLGTGYRLEWDPSRLAPGRHRLFVCAWGGAGGERYCVTLPVVVRERRPARTQIPASPVSASTATETPAPTLTLSGS